jgi:hypothetical protein
MWLEGGLIADLLGRVCARAASNPLIAMPNLGTPPAPTIFATSAADFRGTADAHIADCLASAIEKGAVMCQAYGRGGSMRFGLPLIEVREARTNAIINAAEIPNEDFVAFIASVRAGTTDANPKFAAIVADAKARLAGRPKPKPAPKVEESTPTAPASTPTKGTRDREPALTGRCGPAYTQPASGALTRFSRKR